MVSNKGFALEIINVSVEGSGIYRGTEIVADLRNVAETLFHPFRSIGFWDKKSGEHLCAELLKREECIHEANSKGLDKYRKFLEEKNNAILEISFTHAEMSIFLA